MAMHRVITVHSTEVFAISTGAAVNSTAFIANTSAVMLSSDVAFRYKVGGTASLTNAPYIPANFPIIIAVTPGDAVSVLGAAAGSMSVSVVGLGI